MNLLEKNDLPSAAVLSKGSMIRLGQQAAVDFIVMGTVTGSDKNLKVSIWLLDMKYMKLSGEIAASGPLSALPQMENELAWMIVSNSGMAHTSREIFRSHTRIVPNTAYACYIESFHTSSESEQIRLLQKAVGIYGVFPDARFQLGRLYYQKKEWGSAIPHLLSGIGRNDLRFPSQFMLGNCYLMTGKYNLAIDSFSQILYFSRSMEILNNLGVAYIRIQNNEAALRTLLEAKSFAGSDFTIAANLALTQFLLGNPAIANTILREALTVHPENGLLLFFQGFLLKEQGEGERAEAILVKAKRQGIPVEKLQSQAVQTWARPFINLISSKVH